MRIPDEVRDAVCYLCVRTGSKGKDKWHYLGTAFFVAIPSGPADDDPDYHYLVTAKHCIEGQRDVFVRINTTDGKADYQRVSDWRTPEDSPDDVAVSRFKPNRDDYVYRTIPPVYFATWDILRRYYVGIGDSTFTVGLFTARHGNERNLPIARAGIIAAMPSELIEAKEKGKPPYRAYLVEIHSTGGVSGSPVFVVVEHARNPNLPPDKVTTHLQFEMFLIGVLRGDWLYRPELLSAAGIKAEELSAGITTVTPIEPYLEILYGRELRMEREKERDEEESPFAHVPRSAPLKESSAVEGNVTHEGFDEALRRASRRVTTPEPEQGEE